jgi:hypothetical protein
MDARRQAVIASLANAPADLPSVEKQGQGVMAVIGAYHALEGSGDTHLETILALRSHEVYRAFGDFLDRVGRANPDFKMVLVQKSKESYASAGMYLDRCKVVAQKSVQVNPASRYCQTGTHAALDVLLTWESFEAESPSRSDPQGERIQAIQTGLFAGKAGADEFLELAQIQYEGGYLHHSAAASAFGSAAYPAKAKEFKTVLGCSLARLGYLSEANFHLRGGDSLGGLREKCYGRVVRARSGGGA